MTRYLAESALLPDGVAESVRLDVDAAGHLREVTPNAAATATDRPLRGLVLPGMPNLHGHAFQRAMAGLAESRTASGDTFWSWRRAMYGLVSRLTPDQVEAIAAQAYIEMLEAGYTHATEFNYLHHRPDGAAYDDPLEMAVRLCTAQKEAGIGLTLLPTLYRFANFGQVPPAPEQARFVMDSDSFIRRLTRLAAVTRGEPLARAGVALHSLRAVGLEDLREIPAAADTIDPAMPIHIHVAEQEREVEACRAAHGTTPVALLLDRAPVDGRWCVVHATHMTAAETEALARSGAVAGLCPTTEANLGDGPFDCAAFTRAGGRFGIGSDSHVSIDPRAELRLLEYTQRLAARARNLGAGGDTPHTGRALYQAALDGGTQAAGVAIGRLAAGRRADLVVLDSDHPSLAAASGDRLIDAYVFCEHGTPVRDVAVAGSWVVSEGRHHAREAVAARYRDCVRSLDL
jgi:formimidoylglutamate deiminase